MAYNSEDGEIECEILASYGIFSHGNRNWNKEINLISWNGMPAKLDIRNWQRDHQKCGKGIAITRDEAEGLLKLLNTILSEKSASGKSSGDGSSRDSSSRRKPGAAGTENKTRKKKIIVPQNLEQFYDELELLFGSGPDECKSARNTLLKKYHPDKNPVNAGFANRKTIKIKEAYDRIIAWWNENAR